jgi:O-antigen ligase
MMPAEDRAHTKNDYPVDTLVLGRDEEPTSGPSVASSSRLSATLDAIGHGLIVLLPIAMVLANRSSPLLLSCAAFFVMAARLVSKGSSSYRQSLKRVRSGDLIVALSAMAYALISLNWTMRPALAAFALGEAILPVLAGAVLIMAWRLAAPPSWMIKALARAMLIAAGLICIELLLNQPLRRLLGGQLGPFAYNRPVVTILLLLWPVLALLGIHRQRMLCLVLLLGTAGTIVLSDSEAAKLGLLAAVGASVLVYARSAWASRLFAVVLLGLVWIQPWFGSVITTLVPERLIEMTEAGHSRERLEVWQAFSEVARDRFAFGTGFASSLHVGSHPVAAGVDPAYRHALNIGHPHNAYLQVWVELGLPGALLLSWLILTVLSHLSRMPADPRSAGYVVLICAAAIALVSHGAWQGWWISAIALSAALLTIRTTLPSSR